MTVLERKGKNEEWGIQTSIVLIIIMFDRASAYKMGYISKLCLKVVA